MLENLKSYLIVAGVSILSTVAIYTYILKNVAAKDAQEIAALKGQTQILQKLAEDQAKQNELMKKNVDSLTISVDKAHKNTTDALAILEKMKKPVVIDPVNSIEEVKTAIAEHYNDNGVVFVPGSQVFEIAKTTTFNLVDDAIEWKINGPILKDNLFKTDSALKLSLSENAQKDLFVNSLKDLNNGLNNSLNLSNQSGTNKDRVITLLDRDLKIKGMNGKIKFVLGIGVGAGSYYVIDKLIKR